jgi:hypothetical protein
MNIEKINNYIQDHMIQEDITSLTSIEAAHLLEAASLLKDSPKERTITQGLIT